MTKDKFIKSLKKKKTTYNSDTLMDTIKEHNLDINKLYNCYYDCFLDSKEKMLVSDYQEKYKIFVDKNTNWNNKYLYDYGGCYIDIIDDNDFDLIIGNEYWNLTSLEYLELILFIDWYIFEILDCNTDINIWDLKIDNNSDCDTDDLKDKCFCDYCDDFVPTSECETLEIEDVEETYFEIACSECYNNLYKDNK